MKKPNFIDILPLFDTSKEFSLTESQYFKKTGATMPKDTYYLKNKSALSNIARKHGYVVEINERTICLKKAI